MHFGQKDTEDDSVRITIFLQFRPLHLKGVSFFSSSPISFSLLDSTFESEEDKDEDEANDAAAFSPTPSPFSSTIFADDDAEAVAAVEVARVVDEAVGMGGGKSSSSPPAFFAVVVDFAADDDILMVFF